MGGKACEARAPGEDEEEESADIREPLTVTGVSQLTKYPEGMR